MKNLGKIQLTKVLRKGVVLEKHKKIL